MSKLGSLIDKTVHRFPKSDARLPIPGAKVGIEVELENWDGKNGTQFWAVKEDHSLRNKGIEFVTNGPVIGEDIMPAIDEVCKLATERKYSIGEPRAAIHIHLDMTDVDVERNDLARFVHFYMVLEHAFFGFAGMWREHCGYCIPYEYGKADFRLLGKVLHEQGNKSAMQHALGNMSKYQALNLVPLTQFGTVEFRHLPTTFDPVRIKQWVTLILALKRALDNPDIPNALEAFSKHGPIAFAELVLGAEVEIIRPYIDPNRMWAAVDNATAVMAAGNALKPIGQWSDVGGQNPFLKLKADQLAKSKSKTGSKKDVARDAEENLEGVMRPDDVQVVVAHRYLRVVPNNDPREGDRIFHGGSTYQWSAQHSRWVRIVMDQASFSARLIMYENQILQGLRNRGQDIQAEQAVRWAGAPDNWNAVPDQLIRNNDGGQF